MTSLIRLLGDLGARLTRITERWFPDSWVVCMILTAIALLLAVFLGFRTTMFIALFIYVVAFVQMLMLQRGAVARGAVVQAPSAAE